MYKDTTELFINDLKFSSIAKLLKVAVDHEAGHSMFTDSCRLRDERAAGTEFNGVSIKTLEQLTSKFPATSISCEYNRSSSLLGERQPSSHFSPFMASLRSCFSSSR